MVESAAVGRVWAQSADGSWFITAHTGSAPIRFDVRCIDRIVAADNDLVFEVEELVMIYPVSEGIGHAHDLARHLGRYTRFAQIADVTEFEQAKRALVSADSLGALFIGSTRVSLRGEYLVVGDLGFSIFDVCDYAARGALLPTGTTELPASLALLAAVVDQKGNRTNGLAKRLMEFTRRSRGHGEPG